ncbi:MAG: hypothetical protein GOU99_02600 [Candidatus Altiarchaeota archaeon]|nr:hypothetical protein [Candidatus Altiarchaeota archaeon]
MDRMKGQLSIDYAASVFIFATTILFMFVQLFQQYHVSVWEVDAIQNKLEAERIVRFLTQETGNWSSYPFNSSSLAFGGSELNQTRLDYFVGMPYSHVQNKLDVPYDFQIVIKKLPSIVIIPDIKKQYSTNSSVDTVRIRFDTMENTNLTTIIVGLTTDGRGASHYNTSSGKFHSFIFSLKTGNYEVFALSTVGDEYGIYQGFFEVITVA